MATITADHIRILAGHDHPDAAIVVVGDEVQVVPGAEEAGGRQVYTRANLFQEYGEEITDVEAELLASALTARLESED
jgi:hypothetical protein